MKIKKYIDMATKTFMEEYEEPEKAFGYSVDYNDFCESWVSLPRYKDLKFEFYYTRDYGGYIPVVNVKRRGTLDYNKLEELNRELAKYLQVNIADDDYLPIISEEKYYEIWNHRVELIYDDMKEEYPDLVVVGRMGGYWGLNWECYSLLAWNEKELKKIIAEVLANHKKELRKLEKEDCGEWCMENELFAIVDNNINHDDLVEALMIDKEKEKIMKAFIKELYLNVEEMEHVSTWYEFILDNEDYYL